MQRTAPSSIPRRQEDTGRQSSPALMMASRIRAEQGPERAAQYLSAMEPFLAPGERIHIAYTLGLPIPQQAQPQHQPAPQPPMPSPGPLGAIGNLGSSLGNIGSIMQMMQLMNGLQNNGNIMQMLGSIMGNGKGNNG